MTDFCTCTGVGNAHGQEDASGRASVNRSGRGGDDEDFTLTDMGCEQGTAPRRKRKKYEVVASAHPDFVTTTTSQPVCDDRCVNALLV